MILGFYLVLCVFHRGIAISITTIRLLYSDLHS
jgi:hypothetical protein